MIIGRGLSSTSRAGRSVRRFAKRSRTPEKPGSDDGWRNHLIPMMVTSLLDQNQRVCCHFASGYRRYGFDRFSTISPKLSSQTLGLTPRQKLAGQIITGLAAALAINYYPGLRFELANATSNSIEMSPTATKVPIFGALDLGWLYIPFAVAVIVGASNAVNLTDGLDGLAAGSMIVATTPFLVFAYVCGHLIFARHLGVAYIPGVGELAVICAALIGGSFGFLWHNAHPAAVFMGDTGSLALGGSLGAIALCSKTEVFLAIVGGIFVIEALSEFFRSAISR